jgi:8-oxo-dGTP pyrophosphatase MutT (NUDIX family)
MWVRFPPGALMKETRNKKQETNYDGLERREFSAGGVVCRKYEVRGTRCEVKFLLGMHSGYHKWVLPKGMIEVGETAEEAAVREVKEEMGVEAKIVQVEPLNVEQYEFWAEMKIQEPRTKNQETNEHPERRVKTYQEDPDFEKITEKVKIEKTVKWYLMEWVKGEPTEHDFEMEEGGWFTFEEAMEMLSFEGEKKALQSAHDLLSK